MKLAEKVAVITGGTTGMPKGVMWRQADIYVSSLGGRPFGAPEEWESVDALVAAAAAAKEDDDSDDSTSSYDEEEQADEEPPVRRLRGKGCRPDNQAAVTRR